MSREGGVELTGLGGSQVVLEARNSSDGCEWEEDGGELTRLGGSQVKLGAYDSSDRRELPQTCGIATAFAEGCQYCCFCRHEVLLLSPFMLLLSVIILLVVFRCWWLCVTVLLSLSSLCIPSFLYKALRRADVSVGVVVVVGRRCRAIVLFIDVLSFAMRSSSIDSSSRQR